MTASLDHRRAVLTAALGFMQPDHWTERAEASRDDGPRPLDGFVNRLASDT
jgi:hypothetical protein